MNHMPPTARVTDAIRANDMLSKLRAPSKEKLIAGALLHELEKGATICHQGAPAIRFCLVLSGQIKLVRYTTKAVALLVDIVLPNQLFGAVFHDHNPVYPCSALGMRRTELLSFRLKDLIVGLEENAPLLKMLLANTCDELCQSQRIRSLWLEEARIRIAHLLLYLLEKFGRVIPETRATLAELAGTSVETATRVTTALVRGGILATRRGQIEILSIPALRSYAQE
jgi:CRP-like cAMP-binding protein